MNILTIVIIAIFFVLMGMGFARGLIKSVFKIVITGLSVLLAYLLAPVISELIIENTNIDNTIRNKIYAVIEAEVEKKIKEELDEELQEAGQVTYGQLVEEQLETEPNRNSQIEFIQDLELPEFLQKALIDNNNSDMKQEIGVANFYDYVSTYLSKMVVNAIGFFVAFFVLCLVLNLTLLLMNAVMKLPGLNMLNRLGGMALGFIESLLMVWIIFLVIDVSMATAVGGELMEQINESELLTIIHDNNLLSGVIEKIIKKI